jgi:hypothetical protein
MLPEDEIAQLRRIRDAAIANFDFQKAKVLDVQIKLLGEQLHTTRTEEDLHRSQGEYDAVKEAVRREAAVLHARAVESISKIDIDFQDRLRDLLTSQAKDKATHATEFASDLELSTIRPVPESARMKREACLTAKCGDFETADLLYEQAVAAHEAALALRQQEIAASRGKADHHLSVWHEEQLRLNRVKQQQRIGEVRLRYVKGIEKLKKQLFNASVKWHIAQNEAEEAKFFVPLGDDEDEPPPPARPSRGTPSRADARSRVYPRFARPDGESPRGRSRTRT